MNNNRGFTLIELLVVIAIIGILASVVLASLNTARQKGTDAKIKAELSNARAQGQLYFDDHTSFYTDGVTNVCTDTTGVYNMLSSVATVAGGAVVINGSQDTSNAHCNTYTDGWMIQAPLKVLNQASSTSDIDYYCVDSTGASKIEDLPVDTFVEDTGVDPATGTPIACL